MTGPALAFRGFWTGYARFTGRATRAEFWWWVALFVAITAVIAVVAALLGGDAVVAAALALWGAATILPGLALMARRMHDVDLSAWVLLAALVPTLGWLALLAVAALPANPRGVRFAGGPGATRGADLDGGIPSGDPDQPPPEHDYGWPPLPLPYAGPAGGQPLFAEPPPDEDESPR